MEHQSIYINYYSIGKMIWLFSLVIAEAASAILAVYQFELLYKSDY